MPTKIAFTLKYNNSIKYNSNNNIKYNSNNNKRINNNRDICNIYWILTMTDIILSIIHSLYGLGKYNNFLLLMWRFYEIILVKE